MLYLLFQAKVSEEEAEQMTGRKWLAQPDRWFLRLSDEVDLNTDETFIKYLYEIDKCDIPMRNVARDLLTGDTHSFDKISTGVRMLWFMRYHPEKFLFPSQFLGENCYQGAIDLSIDRDIYIYEDSNMFDTDEIEKCKGTFTDYHTGEVVNVNNYEAFDYFWERGYGNARISNDNEKD